ncbi:putative hydrolase YcgS [Actinorhabdospora filicis]|uniref:Hydrolase YcgS n=1 Tax=Actinorhabdospora filicis TaxID=1785913 RepID=A0A9W6WAZ9_9ACTN|nr:alpha/beta hydrolase [Actinorhabdospora filicis]GLZ78200.1 putative hydrolase YcgS [Actinorhabdospora filicis]
MRPSDLPTTVTDLAAGPIEYRFDRHGDETVVIFYGGHMRAGLALGEADFTGAGYSVLVPSRPGYGRTPLTTGTTPAGFADVTAELCAHVGVGRLAAVVGVSAGGRTAVAMAARHPRLVERLLLESAVSFQPWPGRFTRLGARVVFHPAAERATWAMMRALLRTAPTLGLRSLMGSLSAKPVGDVLAALTPAERETAIGLFARMRSGAGFCNDLIACPDLTAEVVQPALVIATRTDAAVPFAHAEALTAGIPHARLLESTADGHLIWLSPDHRAVTEQIRHFLSTPLTD